MRLVFYADVVFAFNFLINFLILSIMCRLCHENNFMIKMQWVRLIIGAVLGGFQAVIYPLLLLFMTSFTCWLYRICGAFIICKIAFRNRSLSEWFCDVVIFYGTGAVVAGISQLAGSFLPRKELLIHITVILAAGIAGLVICVIIHKKKHTRQEMFFYQIVLKNQNQIVRATALMDSGNHLFEPISGKPVMLVSQEISQKLHPEPTTFRIIPYTSVGRKRGTLEAYHIDELDIMESRGKHQIKDVYIAVAGEILHKTGPYQAILHQDFFLFDTSLNKICLTDKKQKTGPNC